MLNKLKFPNVNPQIATQRLAIQATQSLSSSFLHALPSRRVLGLETRLVVGTFIHPIYLSIFCFFLIF